MTNTTKRGSATGQRQQSIAKTARDVAARAWVRSMVQLSDYVPGTMRLAEWGFRSYKDKRRMRRFLGERSYISSRAQVDCPGLTLGPRCFIDDYVTIYADPKAEGRVEFADRVHVYRWSIIELGAGPGSLFVDSQTAIQSSCVINPSGERHHHRQALHDRRQVRLCLLPARSWQRRAPMREQPLTSRGDIVLEDDVWLGLQVCVMDGVTIGKGAVVGAGSVVTKDIPAYTVAAGVPARVIRERRNEASADLAAVAVSNRNELGD